jgi:hypothetical protein
MIKKLYGKITKNWQELLIVELPIIAYGRITKYCEKLLMEK